MAAPSKEHWQFGRAILASLLRGRWFLRGGHLPPSGHSVGDAFVGVGVAAADDPAVDDFTFALLRSAGISRVRLDFSPGDESKPAKRLLERLCAEQFQITLHLVQARDEARRMPSKEAGEAWRKFVVETLDRVGSRVEMIELGTTVNRKRWAGHSIAGFLAMWEIAWKEVRARGLKLAGPNVTDFEPPWNVGLLELLRLRGQLPDWHSDNLFSERCTEPERFDQKILGRTLASWHKFNLIKKARLLARIGADSGVSKLVSLAAFWTLPRIERMLPDSEQKQADYLARYLVLCAASGALERAWWGPLVCHREGLVDNGPRAYPEMERITHYARVEGALGDLRVRPSFHALRAFVSLIPGCRYEGRLNKTDGLEVHAFRSGQHLVHVVWTINGRAAALDELYQAQDLADACFRNRDGELEPAEDASRQLIGESPRYLSWSASRQVALRPDASLLSTLAVAWHGREGKHYLFRDRGWRGVIFARSASEADLLLQSIHPERLVAPSRENSLRHARNAIWAISDPRQSAGRLVVKQPVKMHFHKQLFDRFKPSKGLRSWNGTCELLRRGVSAAPPLGYFERVNDGSLLQNHYLCEEVEAKFTARELIAAFATGKEEFEGVGELEAYRQLSDYLLRMHGRGILFRDLSGGNILIDKGTDGSLSFSLIDTGRIRVFQGALSLRQRFFDLVRICNKLHREGRKRFLGIYLAALRRRLRCWHFLPFMVYDFKVAAKRRVGRKAWKR